MSIEPASTLAALQTLLKELVEGPSPQGSWLLGQGNLGLIDALRSLSAETASRRPAGNRSSIAAHAGHLNYSLGLLNRWAGGEENPFATADWEGSWQRQTVTPDEWQQLIDDLQAAAVAWTAALDEPREWEPMALTGTLASAAHLAYHLGEIRQLALFLQTDGDS